MTVPEFLRTNTVTAIILLEAGMIGSLLLLEYLGLQAGPFTGNGRSFP